MNKDVTWLTEESLGKELELIFKVSFIRDKTVPNSGVRFRPDYRNEELKLIVEYDGPRHYTEAKRIQQDIEKDRVYSDMGYSIVRVPYFIQIESRTIEILFNKKLEFPQKYPHGFNEKNVVLPADFCEEGIKRFKQDLYNFYDISEEIKETLVEKSNILGNSDFVVPNSLYGLLNDEYNIWEKGFDHKMLFRLLCKEYNSSKNYEKVIENFLFDITITSPEKCFPEIRDAFFYFKEKKKDFLENLSEEEMYKISLDIAIENIEEVDFVNPF